jgi:hypothetical protein
MPKKPVKKEVTKKDLNLKRKKELLEEGYIIETDEYSKFKDGRLKPIINWLREGKTDQEIVIAILEIFDVKENTANTYLRAAKSCFKQEMILDRKFNIIQHVKRYDRDINRLAEYQPKTNSYAQTIELKCRAYSDMVVMLQKKERVLGFHQKTTQIKIKNNVNIQLKKLDVVFDFSVLNWEEKIELYRLINKTKISDLERYAIKPNPNHLTPEQKLELTNKSLIPPPPVNVDLIQHKDEEVVIIHDDKDYSNDPNVIDTVDKTTPRKTLDEIKNSVLSNLFKK